MSALSVITEIGIRSVSGKVAKADEYWRQFLVERWALSR